MNNPLRKSPYPRTTAVLLGTLILFIIEKFLIGESWQRVTTNAVIFFVIIGGFQFVPWYRQTHRKN